MSGCQTWGGFGDRHDPVAHGRVSSRRGQPWGGQWWLCPNDPPCPHGAVLHDGDGADEPFTCGAEGCTCGRTPAADATTHRTGRQER